MQMWGSGHSESALSSYLLALETHTVLTNGKNHQMFADVLKRGGCVIAYCARQALGN